MTHISVKKLEGDTWMVWNSLHYPAAGPRCDILADALYAHQIAPRYCSRRWRAHVIYTQCFFVSQLVLKIVPTDFCSSPKKIRKSEIPLQRRYDLLYKSKQKEKENTVPKNSNERQFKVFDAVVGTNILNKLRPISAWFLPLRLKFFLLLNTKRTQNVAVRKGAPS